VIEHFAEGVSDTEQCERLRRVARRLRAVPISDQPENGADEHRQAAAAERQAAQERAP
jgi:hypothetical protein